MPFDAELGSDGDCERLIRPNVTAVELITIAFHTAEDQGINNTGIHARDQSWWCPMASHLRAAYN